MKHSDSAARKSQNNNINKDFWQSLEFLNKIWATKATQSVKVPFNEEQQTTTTSTSITT